MEKTHPLPIALIILIHLHLLNFPLKDASGYDENLFNPQKHGIGERTKTLEDISFFLVGKIEGQKARAKKILPTYPCSQPSDTLAYRAALTKYLETLRSDVLRPSDSDKNVIVIGSAGRHAHVRVAWWWRDVIVRKSLLEECFGFERVLLALSTHALLNNTPEIDNHQRIAIDKPSQSNQVNLYQSALTILQDARRTWERAAFGLTQRQQHLKLLREWLSNPLHTSASKYAILPTNKLLALTQFTYDDIVKSHWSGEDAKIGLDFLVDLSGLSTGSATAAASEEREEIPNAPPPSVELLHDVAVSQTLPLPIAAAHFPSHLNSLRKTSITQTDNEIIATDPPDKINALGTNIQLVDDKLSVEARSQAALQAAFLKAKQVRARMTAQLEGHKNSCASISHTRDFPRLDLKLVDFTTEGSNLDFENTPSSSLLPKDSISSLPTDHEAAIQEHVSQIRGSLTPAWPPIPSVSSTAPSLEPLPRPTRLPQPTSRAVSSATTKTRVAFTASTVSNLEPKESIYSRVGPRKSSALRAGRAHRSFARRKSLAFDQDEVDRIADSFLDESTSDVSVSRSNSPTTPHRQNFTKGQPLTPGSIIKRSAPRPSFDIDQHERAMRVDLPRKSMGHESDDQRGEADVSDSDAEEGDDGLSEGNSMTLKEILLQVDATQYDLLQQHVLLDDSFDW